MAREERSIPMTYEEFRYEVLRIVREDDEYTLLTKTVHELREGMKVLIQKVENIDKNLLLYREDSKEFRREIREENEKFRTDLLGRFGEFQGDIKEENEKFRTDLLGRFGEFQGEIREEIDRRFEQIDGRFEQIDQRFERIDQRFERMEERFERIHQDFMEVFKALNRQIYWMVGSIFAVGGLLLGFIKL